LVNQNEDFPGMDFLNAAFDSSTFVRTNNYLNHQTSQALASSSVANTASTAAQHAALTPQPSLPIAGSSFINRLSSTYHSGSRHVTGGGGSVVLGTAGGSIVNYNQNSTSTLNQIMPMQSSCQNLITAKSSICTNYLNGSISSKTNEGRALWLQNLSHAAAVNAASKRAYCSKTQVYCAALSKSLDMRTTRVVPFFGAFLHDLRFILDSVPSVNIVCNKNVQKPIEVLHLIYENCYACKTQTKIATLIKLLRLI
jgi:hypothetical protein